MTSWNRIQPGMPYRCNYVPLASACKNVSLRNASSGIVGLSGSCDSLLGHCPNCTHSQPVRLTANVNCLHVPSRDAMNSTYYHHQCYRRNVWVRGASSVSTTQLTPSSSSGGGNVRPELFLANGFQRMTMFGQQPWRGLHDSGGFGGQNGDRRATSAAVSSSLWNHSSVSQELQRRQSAIDEADRLRRAVDNVRQWQYTEAGLAHLQSQHGHRPHRQQPPHRRTDDAIEFIVVSYNVLAQCLLEDNLSHLYHGCRSEDLSWENRRQRLVDEFRRTDADVLCLQEVQCDHYDSYFVPELAKLGYKGLYKKRTGDKRDGCAIFFRESVFELDQSASIEYRRKGMPVLNRDNIAVVAVLRVRRDASSADDDDEVQDDGRRLCVANTHLLFNPKRGDIRLAQMQILFAEVDRLAFRGFKRSTSKRQRTAAYHPIIVCGDMNSRPQCHLYQFIVSGSLKYEGLMAGDVSNPNAKRSSPKRGKMLLEKELVPSQVGITDRCQYHDTSESRRRTAQLGDADDDDDDAAADDDVTNAFSSGQMTHGLCLVSAYGHRLDDDRPEVTTHHDRASCTVDYIFYSVKKKHSPLRDDRIVHERVAEGRLSLLATHSLPSSAELNSFGGLPNAVLPSDHVQLAAKFLLKTK